MPEHFTKNTLMAKFWCNPCGKETLHNVNDGRRGTCLDCLKKREDQMVLPGTEEKQPEQLTLMEIYGTVDIG